MIQRKLIGILLIVAFLVPLIPLMHEEAMFNQGQMTEERADQLPDPVTTFNETESHGHSLASLQNEMASSLYMKRQNDDHFLSRQADDIQTPPPNKEC